MNYKDKLGKFSTCEIHTGTSVTCFAKLANGRWVAVRNGNLDDFEITPIDFESMLEVVSTTGAEVRFTNHSAV